MRIARQASLVAVTVALLAGCGQGDDANSRHGTGLSAGDVELFPGVNSSDPAARVFDGKLYVYTSRDKSTAGKTYPMDTTYAFALAEGADKNPGDTANWSAGTAVLSETDYSTGPNAFVTSGTEHLWAPDIIQTIGFSSDGPGAHRYYLYVPDTDKTETSRSKIGVSTSTSPTGPFTFQKTLVLDGYASDPAPFVDFDGRAYMIYANGGWDNCGGLSIAELYTGNGPDTDYMTVIPGSAREIAISGVPQGGHSCSSHAYLEGASLDFFGQDGNNKYFLYFPVKGTANSEAEYEYIGYATADSAVGPFTYQGKIMEASSTTWTNQASIVLYRGNYIFFYHDSKERSTNRRVYATCLTLDSSGQINKISRSDPDLKSCWKRPSTLAQVAGLKAWTRGYDNFISWKAVPGATYYTVERRDKNYPDHNPMSERTSATSYLDRDYNLTSGDYTYTVMAHDETAVGAAATVDVKKP
jgi:hypothetical protein